MFSREYSVLELAKYRSGMVRFSVVDVEIAGLRVEDMPKRWVILLSLFTAYSMQLGTKRNYKVVEEKLLDFVLVYK